LDASVSAAVELDASVSAAVELDASVSAAVAKDSFKGNIRDPLTGMYTEEYLNYMRKNPLRIKDSNQASAQEDAQEYAVISPEPEEETSAAAHSDNEGLYSLEVDSYDVPRVTIIGGVKIPVSRRNALTSPARPQSLPNFFGKFFPASPSFMSLSNTPVALSSDSEATPTKSDLALPSGRRSSSSAATSGRTTPAGAVLGVIKKIFRRPLSSQQKKNRSSSAASFQVENYLFGDKEYPCANENDAAALEEFQKFENSKHKFSRNMGMGGEDAAELSKQARRLSIQPAHKEED